MLYKISRRNCLLIPILGEIDWSLANRILVDTWTYLRQHRDTKYLLVYISSPGGEPDAAQSILYSLKGFGLPITTIGSGKVYSAAILPFLSGVKRYAFTNTMFLFHPPSVEWEAGDKATRSGVSVYELEEITREHKIDSNFLKGLLTEVIPKKKSLARRLSYPKTSKHMSAAEAMKIKLIDGVVDKLSQIKLATGR